ncbi:MAG: hypothetical protein JST42_04215 [Bacteroidetes bacterium]|nr:hypothetical protein [Bacteroidota bacterium]
MPIADAIHEMEGKISLLDNKKFLCCAAFICAYNITFLAFLTHVLLRAR